jgi:hypothetical protein
MTVDIENSVISRPTPVDIELTQDEVNRLENTWLPDIERVHGVGVHLSAVLRSITGPL